MLARRGQVLHRRRVMITVFMTISLVSISYVTRAVWALLSSCRSTLPTDRPSTQLMFIWLVRRNAFA